jgi:hypothetical protein
VLAAPATRQRSVRWVGGQQHVYVTHDCYTLCRSKNVEESRPTRRGSPSPRTSPPSRAPSPQRTMSKRSGRAGRKRTPNWRGATSAAVARQGQTDTPIGAEKVSPLPSQAPSNPGPTSLPRAMRRSARRPPSAPSEKAVVRSDSPSTSEITLAVPTPSVSPVPEAPTRQYGTPGQRADGAPKRPMNAFILFSNEMRSVLADQNPSL